MKTWKTSTTFLIGVLLIFSMGISIRNSTASPSGITQSPSQAFVDLKARSEISTHGSAQVIIILKQRDSNVSIEELSTQAEALQQNLLTSLRVIQLNASVWERISDWWNPADLVLNQQYHTIPALAGELREESFNRVMTHPAVKAIFFDGDLHALRFMARDQTNTTLLHSSKVGATQITGSSQTICLIDTGMDYTHPELSPLYIGGKDIVNNDFDPMDDNGHGTHLSGIIHAMAPNTTIAAVKAVNNQGAGSFSNVIAGIDWCTSNKQALNISVISMSIGDQGAYTPTTCPSVFNTAVASATTAGITVVAASGNDYATNGISLPACTPNVISVGSVSRQDTISSFTNRGPGLDLLAPGESINSTKLGGGYSTLSGTSVSTPFVAASIALLQHLNSLQSTPMQPQEIEKVLTGAGNNITGWPRLNTYAAASTIISPSPPLIISQIIFEDINNGNLSVPFTLRASFAQEIHGSTNTKFNLTPGIYNLTIYNLTIRNVDNRNITQNNITQHNISGQGPEFFLFNITLESLNFSTSDIRIVVQQILSNTIPYPSAGGFGLNLESTLFSRMILSIQHSGARIYICPSWNMSRHGCLIENWSIAFDDRIDIIPNTTYTITTYSASPGFFFHTNASANRDTYLSEGASGTNFGRHTILKIGNRPGRLRSLIYLNLTPLPTNTTVQDASLTIHTIINQGSAGGTIGVHRILTPWIEGTSQGQHQEYQEKQKVDGATWNASTPTTEWQKPGGDISSQPISTTISSNIKLNMPSNETSITLNITSFVQGIANQTWNNYGLAILSQEEASPLHVQSFASSDHPNNSMRPSITMATSEHETKAPEITFASLSSNESLLWEAVCIIANITDESAVPFALTTITNPDFSSQSVILLDNQSTCNSPGFDHVFSEHFMLQQGGTYTISNITATDEFGNQHTSRHNITMLVRSEPTPPSSYKSPSFAQEGSWKIPTAFLTSKNEVGHAFIISAQGRKEIITIWNTSYTTEWTDSVNVSIESMASSDLINQSVEYFNSNLNNSLNNSTWTQICTSTTLTRDTTHFCDLTSIFRKANDLRSLTLRIVYTSFDTINHTVGIDFIGLRITARNDTQAPFLSSEKIVGINQTSPNYTQHTSLNFSINVSDDRSIDRVTSLITMPNGSQEILYLSSFSNLAEPINSIGVFMRAFAGVFNQTTQTGTYLAVYSANDTSGNKNTSPQLQFNIYESRNASYSPSGNNSTLSNQTKDTPDTPTNDTKTPSITSLIVSPTLTNPGSHVTINATIADTTKIVSVTATILQSNGSTIIIPMTSQGENAVHARMYQSLFFPSTTDPGGIYQVTIQSRDETGNVNTSNTATFTINDTTQPALFDAALTLDNQSHPAPAIVTLNSPLHLHIKVKSTDNTAVSEVLALIIQPDQTTQTFNLNTTGEGVYTGTYTLPLQEGTFTTTLFSRDTNGNINSFGPISTTTQLAQSPPATPNTQAPLPEQPIEPLCTPSWTCTELGPCQEAKRTRTCTDLNQCQTNTAKPSEIHSCFGSTTVLTTHQQQEQTTLTSEGSGEPIVHERTTPSSQRTASIKVRGEGYAPFEATPTIPWYLTAVLTIAGILGTVYLTLRPSPIPTPFHSSKRIWNIYPTTNHFTYRTNRGKPTRLLIWLINLLNTFVQGIISAAQMSIRGIWMCIQYMIRITFLGFSNHKEHGSPPQARLHIRLGLALISFIEQAIVRITSIRKKRFQPSQTYTHSLPFLRNVPKAIIEALTESIQGIVLLTKRIIHKLLRQ